VKKTLDSLSSHQEILIATSQPSNLVDDVTTRLQVLHGGKAGHKNQLKSLRLTAQSIRRYAHLFEICKALINLTVLCLDIHIQKAADFVCPKLELKYNPTN
jgi:hypothetical protein